VWGALEVDAGNCCAVDDAAAGLPAAVATWPLAVQCLQGGRRCTRVLVVVAVGGFLS